MALKRKYQQDDEQKKQSDEQKKQRLNTVAEDYYPPVQLEHMISLTLPFTNRESVLKLLYSKLLETSCNKNSDNHGDKGNKAYFIETN